MNIAIVGYGKMGHEIENIAEAKGINVVSIIDPTHENATHKEINDESMNNVDICVDFTHPDSAVENIKKISSLGKNIVVGTTGWYDNMGAVKKIAEEAGIGLIWSGNFSIGVNIFFKIIKNTSKIMNKFDDYDVFVHEFHHNQKADSPSGTAVMIGNILLENIDRKDGIITEELKRKIEPNELHVSSTRSGSIPGTHIVGFDSVADTIELKHTARGRQGFASGALVAAEWIKGKKGFFNIEDMMKNIIGSD
ncbi:4-hydroxy-tetrahydrodipicolinate reductase [Candidatus Woesearchaeota archaeon]|nr:4-hydroxy-tetrahydrodipicolinate reductase [Candidatus Woesearchaeota archaeon]|tara:strand:+ start:1841 stop:2593 length:753 start_codon:yes stop_codon:yes gene_type:complete